MLEGLVTVGRGSLLITLALMLLLGCALGYGIAVLLRWLMAPVAPTPPRTKCGRAHCDDAQQLREWAGKRGYTVITNERLAEMKLRTEFAHRRVEAAEEQLRAYNATPTKITPLTGTLTPAQDAEIAAEIKAFDSAYEGRRRAV